MLLDAQEFVMVEQQVMMKLLLNDLLMMNIGVCFVMGTYYIIANDSDKTLETIIINYANTIGFSYHYEKHVYYITVNGNWVLDHKTQFGYISKYIVPIEDFCNTEIGFHMMRYTFCVDTQISTSRELNRVSPNNIAEKSTRYVYEDGSICRPHWISKEEAELFNNDNNADLDEAMNVYLNGCKRDFEEYKILVDKYKIHRQDARGKLPLDTATRCIYTYSINEWRHIIDLRYYGTTGKPHPNAKLIAGMIKNKHIEICPNCIFNNYLCYGLLCNIVVLKIIKDEEK